MPKITSLLKLTALLIFGALPLLSSALTIVECVESTGDTSYRDLCQPGMTVKSKKEYPGEPAPEESPSLAKVSANYPVVVFTAPGCKACDLVTALLEKREIPFTAKDASNDPEIQAELSDITGGPLNVPFLTVGESKLSGYNKIEIDTALNSVGYP